MELFGCSRREIEQRFTKSELVLLAWRSQEQAAEMKRRMEAGSDEQPRNNGVPKKYLNDEGEVDMSKMTGDEAYRYLQGIGFPVGMGAPRRS